MPEKLPFQNHYSSMTHFTGILPISFIILTKSEKRFPVSLV